MVESSEIEPINESEYAVKQSLNSQAEANKETETPEIEVIMPKEKTTSLLPAMSSAYLDSDDKLKKGFTRIHGCKHGCFLKVSANEQKRIFDFYWKEATFVSRLKFIQDNTRVSSRICSDQNKKHKNPGFKADYYLNTNEGPQQVCRNCFRIVLAEPDKFIAEVLEEKFRDICSKFI